MLAPKNGLGLKTKAESARMLSFRNLRAFRKGRKEMRLDRGGEGGLLDQNHEVQLSAFQSSMVLGNN